MPPPSGRPPSSTPEKTIERMLQLAGITVPGDDKTRPNRLSGLGALMGLLTGVAFGAGPEVERGRLDE
jgi:hypothetical protein